MEKKRGAGVMPPNAALNTEQQKEFNQKVKEIKDKTKSVDKGPGVIYLGHLAHGFYEPQIRKFFSQFGAVNRVRVSRSKKTGRAKGYAFVEFESNNVAQIVADSMNNYLMFEKLMKCQYMPLSKIHPETFKGSDRKFRKPKASNMSIQRHNEAKSKSTEQSNVKRILSRHKKKLSKLEALGIDYKLHSLDNLAETLQTEESSTKTPQRKGKTTPEPPVPSTVETPGGKFQVLVEDSGDDDITFKTPPHSVRSSKLQTLAKSEPAVIRRSGRQRAGDTPGVKVKQRSGETPGVKVKQRAGETPKGTKSTPLAGKKTPSSRLRSQNKLSDGPKASASKLSVKKLTQKQRKANRKSV